MLQKGLWHRRLFPDYCCYIFHPWICRKWILLEQLVYSVTLEIRSALAYATSTSSYRTVPLLSKPKKPQQLTAAVQCNSCEDTCVKSWCRLPKSSQSSSPLPGACSLTASKGPLQSRRKLPLNYLLKEATIIWRHYAAALTSLHKRRGNLFPKILQCPT